MAQKNRRIAYEGTIDLLGQMIPCYVLDDETRVLSSRGMQAVLKLVDADGVNDTAKLSGVELSRFLKINWLNDLIISENKLEQFQPILCFKGKQRISAYRASALVDFCDLVMEGRKRGLLTSGRQQMIAEQCEVLIRALAKVAIDALVDEATGFQYVREKNALQKILRAYVSDEILDWQLTFHDSFYEQIFRLRKWPFTANDIRKRPGVVGTYTNQFIYDALPPGVLTRLKEQTPKSEAGNYTYRFHQSLTPEEGREHLRNQILVVTTLMSISRTWEEFLELFERKFGKRVVDISPSEPKELPPANPENEFDAGLKGLLSIPPPPKPEKRKKKKPEDEEGDEEAGELVPA